MEFITESEIETEKVGSLLSSMLDAGSVIAFEGEMGAGKTCFTHGFCRGIGYSGEVTSPTFAIVNVYLGGKMPVYHFDMYRVSSWEDLDTTGYFTYLDAQDGILLIEWSENIFSALPENTVFIKIEKLGENKRKITVTGGGIK